jgi:F0F1-type ATP synthase membrane subunit b/b'
MQCRASSFWLRTAMHFVILSGLWALVLFLASLLQLALGRRIGARRLKADPDGGAAGHGAVETAVFGLLGLLLAFTFSGAMKRFDERRQLIGEEATAIATAYWQAELLKPAPRTQLRDKLREYLDARLQASRQPRLIEAGQEVLTADVLKRSEALQAQIWHTATDPSHALRAESVDQVLLPTLTTLFAVAKSRTSAGQRHPPEIIFVMLCGLTLVSALLAGYGMAASKRPSWLHMIGFALSLAATVFVIYDIEFPRSGLIRVDKFDRVLVDALGGVSD